MCMRERDRESNNVQLFLEFRECKGDRLGRDKKSEREGRRVRQIRKRGRKEEESGCGRH